MNHEALTQYFKYLDSVRDEGGVNMFGGAGLLADAFDIHPSDARKVLTFWMNTFDGNKTAEERAKMVASK
jgi:hypothetical protein